MSAADVWQAIGELAAELGDRTLPSEEVPRVAIAELRRLKGALAKLAGVAAQMQIPMLLWCPACGARHIDRGEFATKAHHTHACQGCGMVWRPAKAATVGVEFLPGFKDLVQRPQGEACFVAPDRPVAQGPAPQAGTPVYLCRSPCCKRAGELAVLPSAPVDAPICGGCSNPLDHAGVLVPATTVDAGVLR